MIVKHFQKNEEFKKLVHCYTSLGDSTMNDHLLQLSILGNSSVTNFPDFNDNPNCFIKNVNTACNKLIKYIKDKPSLENGGRFVVWRYTNPSFYKENFVTNFNVHDNITFQTFTSTTYNEFDINLMMLFYKLYTNLAIFKIIVEGNVNTHKKFVFIESASALPTEREVLFVPNTTFKIVKKEFVTIIPNNGDENFCFGQKLIFTLKLTDEPSKTHMLIPSFQPCELIDCSVQDKLALRKVYINAKNPIKSRVNLYNIIPHLLRNDNGYPLLTPINNCMFIDTSIINYLKDIPNKLLSSIDTVSNKLITGKPKVMTEKKSNYVIDSLLYIGSNDTNMIKIYIIIFVIIIIIIIIIVYYMISGVNENFKNGCTKH